MADWSAVKTGLDKRRQHPLLIVHKGAKSIRFGYGHVRCEDGRIISLTFAIDHKLCYFHLLMSFFPTMRVARAMEKFSFSKVQIMYLILLKKQGSINNKQYFIFLFSQGTAHYHTFKKYRKAKFYS